MTHSDSCTIDNNRHKTHDNYDPVQTWLDEDPKKEPWSSFSYYAKASQRKE